MSQSVSPWSPASACDRHPIPCLRNQACSPIALHKQATSVRLNSMRLCLFDTEFEENLDRCSD